jgi:hypothetical protein
LDTLQDQRYVGMTRAADSYEVQWMHPYPKFPTLEVLTASPIVDLKYKALPSMIQKTLRMKEKTYSGDKIFDLISMKCESVRLLLTSS